ncbi:MAG: CinA family protein [Lachnospiraceae bacterium]|nr:CinA family protein [Lachnospiraceae bacterium]
MERVDEKLTLEEEVVKLLQKKGMTITTAESCTGGLIAAGLVNVSGASDVLKLSVVTYSEEAKQRVLGVKAETLEKYGVVSEETAYEMAVGALEYAKADVALSVTGIAGPGGGTKEKPVGLVFIGCNVQGRVTVERHLFQGDRLAVRESSVKAALILAKRCVLDDLEK